MSRITPTVATVLAGIFALLVLLYVFAGGKSSRDNSDKRSSTDARAVQPASAARCSSQETYDLLKGELFRQAADLRGDDAGTFSKVASYAFLRVSGPRLGGDQPDGIIACTGSVTLDLPPGLSVAGGRRSLTSDVNYAVRPGTGGGSDTVAVSNADAIITPLATLSKADDNAIESDEGADADQADQADQAAPAAVAAPRPQPRTSEVPPPPAPRPAPRPAVRAPERAAPTPPRTAPKPSQETAVRKPAAAAPRTSASPSFNCRNARTRGEIAVCGDSSLANLDRQMAGQFNRAVSAADPGKRLQLQRSRNRFLRYRDSCSSEACVAGAYRDRMREIDDIMNERWSPR
jgi:hypothetical protein